MSSPPADVFKALMARVATFTASPALPVSYPEPVEQFDPPADRKYLRADLLTNAHAWQGLSGGHVKQGILQVTVVWPKGQGLVAPKTIVGLIAAHFAMPLVLTSGSAKVTITGDAVEGPTLYEPDSVTIPVSIPWKA